MHNELAAIAQKLTMPYSSFTLAKVKKEFGLTTIEAGRFLPPLDLIAPSSRLQVVLEDLPWAIAKRCCEVQIAVGSEKAKSEGIIYPVLQEVRRIVNQQVSLFSGRDFTVDVEKGLSGYVDYAATTVLATCRILYVNQPKTRLRCLHPTDQLLDQDSDRTTAKDG